MRCRPTDGENVDYDGENMWIRRDIKMTRICWLCGVNWD